MAIESADTCGTQTDGFDRSVVTVDIDAVADFKRFVSQQDHRAEEVFQGILCGQGNGQSTDAESGKNGRDLLTAEDLGNLNDSQNHNRRAQTVVENGHEQVVHLALACRTLLEQQAGYRSERSWWLPPQW